MIFKFIGTGRLYGRFVVCLVVSGLLSGCTSMLHGDPMAGDNSGPASYDYAPDPDEVLISIDNAGGFVPIEIVLRNTADVMVLGDGRTIVAGARTETEPFPGPALRPQRSGNLTADQIQELFRAADGAGLLDEEVDYGDLGITDLPSMTVEITLDGRTFTQSAYGLGFEDEGPPLLTDTQRSARRALQEFSDTALAMAAAASEPYVPAAVIAYRLRGESEIEGPDGEPPVSWPITIVPLAPTGSDVTSCVAVTGAELPALLAALEQATELTPWLIGAEPPARMVFRPQLPGDPGCA